MGGWINGDNFGLPGGNGDGDLSNGMRFNLDQSLGHIDLGKNEWLNFWATKQYNRIQLWLESDGEMLLIEEFSVKNAVPPLTEMQVAVQVMRRELQKMDAILAKWESENK